MYQLTWKILPGLRGLACSEFRAVPVAASAAQNAGDGAVFAEFTDDAARDAFVMHLEETFAPQRFSNNASAFESVKAYVLEKLAQRAGSGAE